MSGLSPARVKSQIDLVGILFVVWGVLTILVGASTLALGIAAAALIESAARDGGSGVVAGVTAAAFTVLAVMAVIWGLGHVLVGSAIRRFRPWSRLAALSLGTVDLVLLPYGTALGVFALWILLREQAKDMFR